MKIYNKLVRDRIPEIIAESGRVCKVSTLSDERYSEELKIKLQEETQEYLRDQNLEELADILEVVFALAKAHGATEVELLQLRAQKREERGGFEKKVYLQDVIE